MLKEVKGKLEVLEGQLQNIKEELGVKSKKLQEKIAAHELPDVDPNPIAALKDLEALVNDRRPHHPPIEEIEREIDYLAETNPAELERRVLSQVDPSELESEPSKSREDILG